MKSFAEICFFFHLSFCWLYKFIFATDHKFEQITVKCRNDPMIELKMTFVIDACKMRSVQSNLFPRKMYWRKFNLAGLVSFEAHLQFRSTVRAILFDTDKFICEKKNRQKHEKLYCDPFILCGMYIRISYHLHETQWTIYDRGKNIAISKPIYYNQNTIRLTNFLFLLLRLNILNSFGTKKWYLPENPVS